jgi:hypothetical protein
VIPLRPPGARADEGMANRITADRLYGLTIRPQELAFYGAQARCVLRSAVMAEDPATPSATHHRLVVLEVDVLVPETDVLHEESQVIQVLKAGWELDLAVDPPVSAEDLWEDPGEARHALERLAACINRVCADAGQPPALAPTLVDEILMAYRTSGS